ncbi:hypothetical protein BBK82_19065 [Lentzea guizhouensis]|uniref:Uncharacterized protein n=1 Tax=Lentzea guizhouensis TaxID=1586287 RepID=A0A1B2HYS9_9PSEU|nr:hypothetical protein BBK82_19065 [Lentzea guizhouensis]
MAPYVTSWSAEYDLPCALVERPDRSIGHATELPGDRDRQGVLWKQVASHRGQGRPEFGKVHPLRQRRAMERLLCQVCGNPADQNSDGVLWLQVDHHDDWPGWPERMASTEPPICRPCAALSTRLCPALRRSGASAVRVREFPIVGVRGALYRPGALAPIAAQAGNFAYGDPALRRVQASALLRELRGCIREF